MIESARPAVEGDVNEYDYLVQGLGTHFDAATSQRVNHVHFRSLRQEHTESAIEFARRIQYLGRQGNFASEEASLVDQLIDGLAADSTRECPLAEGPALTVEKAVQIIQDITEVTELLQQCRATKEEMVQAIEGTRGARPSRFLRR